jgi:hypothetical protein
MAFSEIQIDQKLVSDALKKSGSGAVGKKLREGLRIVMPMLMKSAKDKMPDDYTAELRGQTYWDIQGNGPYTEGIVTLASGVEHGAVIEHGRKSTAFPPVDEIEDWAMEKTGQEGLGFVIARAIAGRTPLSNNPNSRTGWHMMEKTKQEKEKEVVQIMNDKIGEL